MRTQRVLLALAAITGLAGCASMSESECRVADWGRVGYTDGARGDSESRVAAYTEDCGKIGITPRCGGLPPRLGCWHCAVLHPH